MDSILPPGGKPADVADDINVNVSEDEYIIPANVVRYLGRKHFDNMIRKAEEELAELDQNDPNKQPADGPPPDTPPPAQPPQAEGGNFAEGGMVGEGGAGNFGFELKKYTDKNGNTQIIPHINGKPLYMIDGLTEGGSTKAANVSPGKRLTSGGSGLSDRGNKDSDDMGFERSPSPLAGSPEDWSAKNFVDFASQKDSVGNKVMGGIISAMPGGVLALRARGRYLDRSAAEALDEMISKGVDIDGTKLNDTTLNSLQETRASLSSSMSKESGLNLNPLEGLANIFDKVSSFVRPKPAAQAVTSAVSSKGSSAGKPLADPGVSRALGYDRIPKSDSVGRPNKNNSYSGGNRSLGSDMGRTSSSPSSGSMASGGLYARGGIVKRRK